MKAPMFNVTLIARSSTKLGKNKSHGSGLTSSGFSASFRSSSKISIKHGRREKKFFIVKTIYKIIPPLTSSLGRLHSAHFSTTHRNLSTSFSIVWPNLLCTTIDSSNFSFSQTPFSCGVSAMSIP